MTIAIDGKSTELTGKQAEVLSLLAKWTGKTVHIEQIQRIVWNEDESGERYPVRQTVLSTISQIRTCLGASVLPRGVNGLYQLHLDPDDVRLDSVEFNRLADLGHRQLQAGEYAAANGSLNEALEQWSGGPRSLPQIWDAAYRKQRRATLDLAEVWIAQGLLDDAIELLRAYIDDDHPTEERSRQLLDDALTHAGEIADARRMARGTSTSLERGFRPVPDPIESQHGSHAHGDGPTAPATALSPAPPFHESPAAGAVTASGWASGPTPPPATRHRHVGRRLAAALLLPAGLLMWHQMSRHQAKPVTSLQAVIPQAVGASDVVWGSQVTKPEAYASPHECLRPGHPPGLVLTYDMEGDAEGGWVVSWPTQFDASSFTDLVLWVKADRQGATFAVGVKDRRHEEKIETRGNVAVGRDWTEWRIPLALFAPVDMRAVGNVNIGFNASDGTGRLCVGSVAFVS